MLPFHHVLQFCTVCQGVANILSIGAHRKSRKIDPPWKRSVARLPRGSPVHDVASRRVHYTAREVHGREAFCEGEYIEECKETLLYKEEYEEESGRVHYIVLYLGRQGG